MFKKAKVYTKDEVVMMMDLMSRVKESLNTFADTGTKSAFRLYNDIVECDCLMRDVVAFHYDYPELEDILAFETSKLNSYKETMLAKLKGLSAD